MSYYDRGDVFESININKTGTSILWMFVTSVFLDKGFQFQSSICNIYHDVLMIPIKINNIAILNTHGVDCCLNYYK